MAHACLSTHTETKTVEIETTKVTLEMSQREALYLRALLGAGVIGASEVREKEHTALFLAMKNATKIPNERMIGLCQGFLVKPARMNGAETKRCLDKIEAEFSSL